ncbi:MAG: trigger factor [Anaerolineae bacterium]|nr:trigger factor [Anaerolineae bacterium]
MNIQTERLEDHTARVTVELEAERLDQAKKQAAQEISKKVNIPGFRKGKAPYRLVANYVGEAAILEEAVELLSNTIYQEALPQTGLDPYGPGSLVDFKPEPPAFVYALPLQPSVDLKDYQSFRLDFAPPAVEDRDVNLALRNLQEEQAVVELSSQPAVLGNRVTVDIHSHIIEEGEEHEHAEGEEGEDEADTHDHQHGEPFMHEHDAGFILDADGEPVPGFNEQLLGVVEGDTRMFELSVPEDTDKYGDASGKKVHFTTTVKKVEVVTLPELTDDFAARVTKDEEKPLSLLELRMRVRENLEKTSSDRYREDFLRRAIDALVEKAEIGFPEAVVADQVEDFMQDLDQRLRRQGMTLKDYMSIYKKSADDMYADYRPMAVQTVQRQLILRQLVSSEALDVSEESINAEIDRVIERFGAERKDDIRKMFDAPQMRDSVKNDLLREAVIDRIITIAKGEAPAAETSTTEAGSTSTESTEDKEESA